MVWGEVGNESCCVGRQRVSGGSARLGSAWVESGRLGAQRSASGSSPPNPNSAAGLGTDRRSSASARCWMSFGGRALALLPLWLGGGVGGWGQRGVRAAHCT